ncbi:hypothetical protein FNW52_03750 [Flavobacterium sp. ZT3R18]|uniref:hypothetical protein n=1 Tax=Flavobacterium sp. ZT3R18 TaxID=2594429 RepID=UPI00117A5421|nr:hypothetical protein [Flavobacterium sp. ZT3R18]TRX38026.1 hypothetical protein FNW52_03750 [Flavobacterium sp. ZT3R18]
MKQLLSFMFILIITFSGFSQKAKTQKYKRTIKKVEQETIKGTTDDEDVYIVQPVNQVEIDTIYIPAGKPCLIIIDASQSASDESYCFNEEKEIIQNFGKDAMRIVKLNRLSYIIFGNKQTLDVSGSGNSYQGFVYWSGNLKHKVQSKETAYYATEFVAKQMGVDKESSYVVNTPKYKKEIASLIKADNITEKSKEIMYAFLNDLIVPMPYSEDKDSSLSKQCIKNLKSVENLKSIEVYFIEKSGKKIFLKNTVFNKNQQPILSKNYDSEGIEREGTNYIYKNGILIKTINGDLCRDVNYDDNKMIFFRNLENATEVIIFWLENNSLLKKQYLLRTEDTYPFLNLFGEEKIENNCITKYLNNSIWSTECSSNKDIFPFVTKNTSFQNGEVMDYRKTKLVKKGDKLFEKYYSTTEQENVKDDFKLFSVFHLNDQNLLSSYELIENKENSNVKIEYTYFPKI